MSLPPVWMLVCDELPDRTTAAKAHMKERGIEPVYFKAAHGSTFGLETSLEYEPGKRLPPGHVSLNTSSWFMWQCAEKFADAPLQHPLRPQLRFTKGPKDPILFFEDDVEIPEDFESKLNSVREELDRLNPEWDLVFIGLCEQEPQVWHKVTERLGIGTSRLCKLNDPFGTHALMVRRRAIPVLLEHMRKAERNLDQQLFKYVLQPGHLNWCAVLPTLVKQRTYDYAGTGKPQWAPSTLRPGETSQTETAESQGRPSDEQYHATLKLICPYQCIFRGEPLLDHGRSADGTKTVPMSECARLNRACHQKNLDAIDANGEPAERCETCPHRLEMAPSSARDRLPLPEGHFNPSMAMWNGHLILATRDSWGHSKVGLWKLTNGKSDWTGAWKCDAIGSYASAHPQAPRLEDPRLFVAPHRETKEPRLHAVFNLPDGYPPKLVQVGYVCFAKDLSGIEYTEVMPSPFSNAYEKNWQPIVDEGEIRWAYSFKPHHFVMGGTQNWKTPNNLPWTGGVIRGGCTPVLHQRTQYTFGGKVAKPHQPVYYHFYHGCLKRIEGSVYTLGCNVFEAKPPYRILRQTAVPLMWPDLPSSQEDVVKRFVLFPGGAVPHAGTWFICAGVDDTYCRIDRIPFETVEAALTDVPETTREVLSVRDTHIATGVKRRDS